MRRPRWLENMIARERALPRSALDLWIARQREVVLRLPRWLVGSTLVASLALGISWVISGTGLMRWLAGLYGSDSIYAVLGTIAFPILATMIALLVLARYLRPHPPSNLPNARARR